MMSDFTKEELEDMYEAVMDTSVAMLHYLPKKIQDVIDNYCEHEYQEYPLGTAAIPFCIKCQKAIL